jgi:hypothetical protein
MATKLLTTPAIIEQSMRSMQRMTFGGDTAPIRGKKTGLLRCWQLDCVPG